MNSTYVDASSGTLLRSLRAHWWVIVACALLGLTLAGGRMLMQDGTTYSAQSQILVGQPQTLQSLTTGASSNVDQTRLVDFTHRLLQSNTMAEPVEKKLGIEGSDYALDVISANATNVIALRVTTDDANQAKKIANQFAESYVAWVKAENNDKVDQAVKQLTADIHRVDAQLRTLNNEVQDSKNPGLAATVLSPQRTALVQQKVMFQTRLSQAKLAGAIDPTGNGRVLDKAEVGEVPLITSLAPLLLGLLFGALVGCGLAAMRGLRSGGRRRASVESTAPTDSPTDSLNGVDVVLPGSAEPARV